MVLSYILPTGTSCNKPLSVVDRKRLFKSREIHLYLYLYQRQFLRNDKPTQWESVNESYLSFVFSRSQFPMTSVYQLKKPFRTKMFEHVYYPQVTNVNVWTCRLRENSRLNNIKFCSILYVHSLQKRANSVWPSALTFPRLKEIVIDRVASFLM